MIQSVVCCPHPPLLVPGIAAGAGAEVADLLAACDDAVASMLAAGPDVVALIGADDGRRRGLSGLAPGLVLTDDYPGRPLSLAVGDFLLDRADVTPPRHYLLAGPDGVWAALEPAAGVTEPLAADAPLASSAHVALLVMADGSARRSLKGPGYLDPRAQPFDDAVTGALARADTDQLADLDVALAGELLAAGVGPWRALGRLAAGVSWRAQLCYAGAPFGVHYVVARWWRS